MRFFSNDARESADDQADQDRPAGEQAQDRPDRVQSEPVAVPHQRPPSPWSNTPGANETAEQREAGTGRDDTDPPPFHEPAPQPTAFGASTVGGAVAASATAGPVLDRRDDDDRSGGDDRVVTSSTNTYAGSTAASAPDTVPATWAEKDRDPGHDPVVDLPLDDKSTDRPADADAVRDSGDTSTDRDANRDDSVTTFDEPATARIGDLSMDEGRSSATTLKDDGGFDDPKAVDPASEKPLAATDHEPDADREPDHELDTDHKLDSVDELGADDRTGEKAEDRTGDSVPPAAVVAVPAAAAAVPAATTPAATTPAAPAVPVETLFDQDDARSFQERWRDVQLRFVDSPKEAAGDAAKLVDEAVDKLTASLRAQREGLNNDTEDTEQLRVQLRGYRDVLNRILSL